MGPLRGWNVSCKLKDSLSIHVSCCWTMTSKLMARHGPEWLFSAIGLLVFLDFASSEVCTGNHDLPGLLFLSHTQYWEAYTKTNTRVIDSPWSRLLLSLGRCRVAPNTIPCLRRLLSFLKQVPSTRRFRRCCLISSRISGWIFSFSSLWKDKHIFHCRPREQCLVERVSWADGVGKGKLHLFMTLPIPPKLAL